MRDPGGIAELAATAEQSYGQERARRTVARVSPWQRVVQGETDRFRQFMVEMLLSESTEDRAWKYASCGRGDSLVREVGKRLRVQPLCCGSPVCPRCSRRRGLRVARRVREWLAVAPHERIEHAVFTQGVIQGESLKAAAERWQANWKVLSQWWRARGLIAALVTCHFTWSRHGAWHFHGHVLAETPVDGIGCERALEEWRGLCDGSEGTKRREGAGFVRMVTLPGPAVDLEGVDEAAVGSGAIEARALASAIDYPMRDVFQGTASRGLVRAPDEALREVFTCIKWMKRHRLMGRWRKPLPEEQQAELERKREEKKAPAVPGVPAQRLGTMDDLYRAACDGDWYARSCLGDLEREYCGASAGSGLFVDFCRIRAAL